MTPDQYLAQAESLRASGSAYLAQQYDYLLKLRTGEWPSSPSIAPAILNGGREECLE
jgi:hypothetical protein